jgi:hypothetical protein
MSSGFVVMIVLFVVSEAVGVALGEWFFRLFLKAVPPVALSQFNSQSAHFVYLMYGGGVGFVLFIWALIGKMVGGMQRMVSNSAQKT